MKINQKVLFLNILICIIVSFCLLFAAQKGYFNRLKLSALDLSFRLKGRLPTDPHIVIIEINDADIAGVGRWPWKRSWHAAILRVLKNLGAKSVFFDVVFSEPSSEEDDNLFAEEIKLSQNTYLPFVCQTRDCRFKGALLPIEKFSRYLKGTGSINVYPDIDGVIRTIPLFFEEAGNTYPHMALRIAQDYLGLDIKEIKPGWLVLGNAKNRLKIPLLEKNLFLINWAGKWQHTFQHYSFLEVLSAYQDSLENKNPKINLQDFKDSICIIGVTAIGLYDIKPTPLQPEYPAIGVTANAINNILKHEFLNYPPQWLSVSIILLMCLLPAFLIFGEKPFRETICALLVAAIYFALHTLMFRKGLILEFALPALGLFAGSVAIGTYNFVRVAVEKQKFFKMSVTDGLTGLYNIRYFKLLLETEIRLMKHDPARKFCIVMSDVDHFKHFNDTYGHQVGDLVLKEVAAALKETVRTADIVARYGGEEMIVLLRGADLKDALSIAEKLRKNIENRQLKDEKNTYRVTASLGVSVYRPGDDADTVIKRADDGLYKAKESGRNRVSTIEGP